MKMCRNCGQAYKGKEFLCPRCLTEEYKLRLNKNTVNPEKMKGVFDELEFENKNREDNNGEKRLD